MGLVYVPGESSQECHKVVVMLLQRLSANKVKLEVEAYKAGASSRPDVILALWGFYGADSRQFTEDVDGIYAVNPGGLCNDQIGGRR